MSATAPAADLSFFLGGTRVAYGHQNGDWHSAGAIVSDGGNLVGSALDRSSAGTLTIGPSTATSVVVTPALTANGPLVLGSTIQVIKTDIADINTSAANTTIFSYTSITAPRQITTTCAVGSAAQPKLFIAKDQSGNASGTNTITLAPSSGTIDGAASKVLLNSAFGSAHWYANGTNCFTW
jgi:hypothetical protein